MVNDALNDLLSRSFIVGIGCFLYDSHVMAKFGCHQWCMASHLNAPKDVVPKVGLTCLSQMTVRATNPDDLPWH